MGSHSYDEKDIAEYHGAPDECRGHPRNAGVPDDSKDDDVTVTVVPVTDKAWSTSEASGSTLHDSSNDNSPNNSSPDNTSSDDDKPTQRKDPDKNVWLGFGILGTHLTIVLANIALAAALLEHTGPHTGIRLLTLELSLFASYFDPLSVLLFIMTWHHLLGWPTNALFTLRLGFAFAATVLTRQDATTCFQMVGVEGKYCRVTSAISYLTGFSLAALGVELLAVAMTADKRRAKLEKKARGETSGSGQGGVEAV